MPFDADYFIPALKDYKSDLPVDWNSRKQPKETFLEDNSENIWKF